MSFLSISKYTQYTQKLESNVIGINIRKLNLNFLTKKPLLWDWRD